MEQTRQTTRSRTAQAVAPDREGGQAAERCRPLTWPIWTAPAVGTGFAEEAERRRAMRREVRRRDLEIARISALEAVLHHAEYIAGRLPNWKTECLRACARSAGLARQSQPRPHPAHHGRGPVRRERRGAGRAGKGRSRSQGPRRPRGRNRHRHHTDAQDQAGREQAAGPADRAGRHPLRPQAPLSPAAKSCWPSCSPSWRPGDVLP